MISLVLTKIKCLIGLTDKVRKTKRYQIISQLQNQLIQISKNYNRKKEVRLKMKDLKLQKAEN